jgi:hypothetical protein
MSYRSILGLSLAVNGGLAVALWISHSTVIKQREVAPRTGVSARREPGNSVLAARAPESGPSHLQSLWARISTKDYKGTLGSLRAEGCPEPIIHDIIIGAINRRFAPSVKALRSTPSRYWEPIQRRKSEETESDLHREKQARVLEAERNQLVREVLGIDWAGFESSVTGRPDRFDKFMETIGPESRPKVRQVLASYDDLERDVIRSAGGTLGLSEGAELDRLYHEKLDQLSQVLSPREIEDYELRTSSTAEQLKQIGLVGFAPTEDEFRAIFRFHKAFDEQQYGAGIDLADSSSRLPMWEAHYAMEEQLRQALGETRYAEYRRSQDYTFRGLVELTDQFDLPNSAAAQVHGIRESVLQQVRTLTQDPSLDQQQRFASLQTIRSGTENSVRSILGDSAYRRYQQLQIGEWIARIDQQ